MWALSGRQPHALCCKHRPHPLTLTVASAPQFCFGLIALEAVYQIVLFGKSRQPGGWVSLMGDMLKGTTLGGDINAEDKDQTEVKVGAQGL